MVLRRVIDPNGDIVLKLCGSESVPAQEVLDQKAKRVRPNTSNAAAEPSISGVAPNAGGLGAGLGAAQEPATKTNSVELVVSSKILCLISPVFKTLLSGPFRESTEFFASVNNNKLQKMKPTASGSILGAPRAAADKASSSPSSPLYVLDLPDDDDVAMSALMQVSHFCPCTILLPNDGYPNFTTPGPELLERIAVLCDKYQCTSVINAVGERWAQKVLDRMKHDLFDPIKANRLAVFCFVVDLPEAFSAICSMIVKHSVGPVSSQRCQSNANAGSKRKRASKTRTIGHPLLPADFAERLDTYRMAAFKVITQALMKPLKFDPSVASFFCTQVQSTVANYVRNLSDALLLPDDPSFPKDSLHTITERIKVKVVDDKVPEVRLLSCLGTKCSCKGSHIDIADSCRAWYKNTAKANMERKVCLDCMRTGSQVCQDSCRIRRD